MTGTWLAGWGIGDMVSSAEFKKGVGAVFDTTLAAPAANIDFTPIPTTYKSLLLIVRAQSAFVGSADDVVVRINGDTGTNYDWFGLRSNNVTVVPNSAFTTGTGIHMGECPGTSYTTRFSAHVLWIPNYSSAVYRKSVKSEGGFVSNAAGTSYYDVYSAFWNSASAVTQLTVRANGGNLVAGSGATLYVMGS